MKRGSTVLLMVLGGAVSVSAMVYNTNYVSGLHTRFAITDGAQSHINVSAGVVFDPNSQTNGLYDKVYLVNKSSDNTKRGLYLIDIASETYSDRIALAGDDSNDLDSPGAIAIDAAGSVYVAYAGAPSVWKVKDPAGTPVESKIVGNYVGSGDDDPVSISMVPKGFGGGFEAGVDLVVGDSGIDDNSAEGVVAVRTNGTATVLWQDAGTARGCANPVDGYVYSSRAPLERSYLGGEPRCFIRRINGSGVSERVFLDIDANSVVQFDDAIKANPADGSIWLVIQDARGADPEKRNVYRVDVANAVATNGDYVASLSLEIEDLGINVGKNGMAFSPDGKRLVFDSPTDQDTMKVYSIADSAPRASFEKQFFITDTNQTTISTAGGMVFDPASESGGLYDRVYLLNRSSNETNRGVYAVSIAAETTSARLALAGTYGDTALNSPSDIAIDADGTLYVSYSYAPSVWKVEDPDGTPVESEMLGNYSDTADDDIESIALVPSGFGGGYVAGSDLVLVDGGLDVNGANAVTVLDAASTVSSTDYTILWQGYHSDASIRSAASDYDGYVYFARWTLETDDLGGATRAYVNRLDSDGNVRRVFMDIDPDDVYKIDDAIQINPADGSLWLNIESPNSSTGRQIVRVDVANAVATNGMDFVAPAVVAIGESYNISMNAIAFSPDGALMAVPNSGGVDEMFVYDLVSTITHFQRWTDGFGLSGSDADADADPDGDGLSNLYEYGLGGDPTNTADQGMLPTFTAEGGAGSATYVYPKRLDSGLVYRLEINDDLVFGDWIDSGYAVVGTGSINPEFDAVTNQIPTDAKAEQFARLVIEEE